MSVSMKFEFSGELWFWRGPAPWFFVTVPEDPSRELNDAVAQVTYGWGMIPAVVQIGATEWSTSLYPKDGLYLVPVKAKVRHAEALDAGDVVSVALSIAR